MKKKRLELWCAGKIKDDELTSKELRFLEKRVMRALHHRMMNDPTKMTFATHRTVQ